MRKIFILILLLFSQCSIISINNTSSKILQLDKDAQKLYPRVEKFLNYCKTNQYPVETIPQVQIENIIVNKKDQNIDIHFNRFFSNIPFRYNNVNKIYKVMEKFLGRKYKNYNINIYTLNTPIEQLIPNFFRSDKSCYDYSRISGKEKDRIPLVRNISNPTIPSKGLYNRNIAIGYSHGWYYNINADRWEWQRPRLFQTVEDLLPLSYSIQYIIPMLENAGANVFTPRERDWQKNEVIVDNNYTSHGKIIKNSSNPENKWQEYKDGGFSNIKSIYNTGENPFASGTTLEILSDSIESARIEYIPEIPEDGFYGVYISYAKKDSNITDAHYTVSHLGGKTEFLINQSIGGSTWTYLGRFKFKKGMNSEFGKVVLTNKSQNIGMSITSDAIRFGGGMGNIARNGNTSKRSRFLEGSRYNLQYNGMPDTLVYSLSENKNDYKDEYKGRGEWVNYLKGAPFGPNRDRNVEGLQIPIDLYLSFHTDAGIRPKDEVVGTLAIYSIEDYDSALTFPDGVSRLANRDIADIIQTELVDDIRKKHNPDWQRRALYNRQYSEAFTPNVPTVLIELLSHQNFTDMQYAQDPEFMFDTGRSFYKGILKFLSIQHETEYVVQPLPVDHFYAVFNDSTCIKLSWQPVIDKLEVTATPDQYIVYSRKNNGDFDNGVLVDSTEYIYKNIEYGIIYSFKIIAVNKGGKSFPSEILSVCKISDKEPVLIVNGFDRVSIPAVINKNGIKGFFNQKDEGISYLRNFNYTGLQMNYKPDSPWETNDRPGWGASFGTYETKVIPGNTYDYPKIHGEAIKNAGYSFVSSSDEVIMDKTLDISDYQIVDLILGKEKASKPKFKAFTPYLRNVITSYCNSGGRLMISGSYIGTDLFDDEKDSLDIKFAHEILKMELATSNAVNSGGFFVTDLNLGLKNNEYNFYNNINNIVYSAGTPDAINPYNKEADTILRYSENHFSAAIGYRNNYSLVLLGFPFETICTIEDQNSIMKSLLNYLEKIP